MKVTSFSRTNRVILISWLHIKSFYTIILQSNHLVLHDEIDLSLDTRLVSLY